MLLTGKHLMSSIMMRIGGMTPCRMAMCKYADADNLHASRPAQPVAHAATQAQANAASQYTLPSFARPASTYNPHSTVNQYYALRNNQGAGEAMDYEGEGQEEMHSYPADPALDPSSAMPYAAPGSASARVSHHQIRLPKMPNPAMFDGTIKGLGARDWLDTIQLFWDFNMPHAPHLQVTYAVSRLQGEAKRWFDHALGERYSRTGAGVPIEEFRTAFLQRYVMTASVQTARSDWLELKQQTEGTHSFNDHYRAAIQLVALVPGGSAIDGGTAVHQYLEAIRPALRSRMQNFWKAAYVSDLDAVMRLAEHVTDLLDHTSFKRSIPNGQASGQKEAQICTQGKIRNRNMTRGRTQGKWGLCNPTSSTTTIQAQYLCQCCQQQCNSCSSSSNTATNAKPCSNATGNKYARSYAGPHWQRS